MMVSAENIHFCIRKKPILDQVNIDLLPGEVVSILGPNGAGKSTLLKILSGEKNCETGSVSINQVPLASIKPQQLAKYRAVMPQHSTVNFPYTVEEIVALGVLSHDANTPSRQLMEEVMGLTGLGHLGERMIDGLSGGEKQRVQLARVLLQIWEDKPYARYLLLDEPTSSMDIAQQHQVLRLVRNLRKKNIGVLAILHDLNLAAHYSDKVVLMKNGSVKASGPVKTIMTAENLSMVYGHPISVLTHPLDDEQVIITSESTEYATLASIKTA
ncbi:heme ABC transporter ATP-binding protein [Echinicola strongylocentroti]|uniref:Heme ABC transporter ATP-binding protein n=1 Tax=Echinicola strongylocentroti TaxID=1795355 RepID=A0A2Z4IQU4_9BACT|nr:heme ABC transporter ATP-binding protein [Echinicola strongylocentroti]AWW32673.1 heme ABC transporter ATP-binding protein [Echinicola strongylocentroti]